ncbi:hypothetical protein GF338_01195 [candidate division WOR-3 bacterium]|nr:hypothetical protein [candidate division WOR-3 bacterium]
MEAQKTEEVYPKGKIDFLDGRRIEGRNLIIRDSSVTLTFGGVPETFQLSDVWMIRVKKKPSNTGRIIGASGCGGGYLVFALFGFIIPAAKDSDLDASYFVGHSLLTAASVGVGYLGGYFIDRWVRREWEIMYKKEE